MSRIRTASKDTLIYGIGTSIQKIISFLLLPLYTRALSPAEYGVLSTISVLVFFVSTILGFGLDGATGRFFFKEKDIIGQKLVLSTSLVLRILLNFPIIILLSLFAPKISVLLFDTPTYTSAVFIALLLIPFQNINKLQDVIYRYYRKTWLFAGMTIIRAIVFPICGVLFVVYYKWSVFGAQLATFITTIIILIFSYFAISKTLLRFKYFNKERALEMLKFGSPLIFAGIIGWVNSVSDRFFLLHYRDLSEVGLYSIASSFAQPIQLLNTALDMGVGIIILSSFEKELNPLKPETKRFQTQIWHLYLYITIFISLVLSLFSIELATIFTTPDYVPAMVALPWLLLSSILVYSTNLTGNGMTLMMQSKPYPLMLLIAACCNIGLNFYFIPHFGFVGAAITTVLSNFIYFAIAYFWSQKVYYVDRSFFIPVIILLTIMSISVLMVYLQIKQIYILSIITKIGLILALALIPLSIKKYRTTILRIVKKIKK